MSSHLPTQPTLAENTIKENKELLVPRNVYMVGIAAAVAVVGFFVFKNFVGTRRDPVSKGLIEVEKEQKTKDDLKPVVDGDDKKL
ncbi:1 TM domain-containing transmembrane protein [Acrasis kona]|uniref:1 TM domain-containing transmembrane protein n=1 Tax=Acrasis kona TaxID=1008807 RepID=A0AAW2ZQN3_9EUKA